MKQWITVGSAIISGCLLLSGCNGDATTSKATNLPPMNIEIVVRTTENFRSAQDVFAFVNAAAQHKVTAISLLVKQDEDGTTASGRVFYPSALASVAPGYENFDVLQTMLDAAHAQHILVRAWVPQFHDQVAAQKHPDWQMMALVNGAIVPYTGSRQREFFVDPLHPEVQAYELAILEEIVHKYAVDGLMLDWIRFDNYNMDLSDRTRALYRSARGLDPATLDFSKDSAALRQWNAYRTDGIAAYVRKVRAALGDKTPLGLYALPPEFTEVGQDVAKFASETSSIAPMCYFRDWGYPLEWVWSSCLSSTVQKSGTTEVVPAMDSFLSDTQYQAIFQHLRTDFPRIKTIAWFYHDRWTVEMLQRIEQLSQH